MNDIVIKVEHLSKRYKIGGPNDRHDMLRDVVMHGFASLFRNGASLQAANGGNGVSQSHARRQEATSNHIWALNEVSLDIHHGEVVGFIGRNGAGKSTLLKILSRITEPTKGRVQIRGRIGTLLEVGAGFHSELTGRENVYLSGAVLGMSKREIDR